MSSHDHEMAGEMEAATAVAFSDSSSSNRLWKCGRVSFSFVTLLSVFAAMGGFLFGYDIGVIGGVKDMEEFRRYFGEPSYTRDNITGKNTTEWKVSDVNQGWIVGSFSLGCLVGALIAGVVAERRGRRITVLLGSVIFTVGGLVQALSYYIWMVYLGRVVAGFGVGILSMIVPVYNAEVSPAEHRGRLVSLNQLSITAGIMVSFLINLACETYVHGWRISLALQALFSILLFVGMLYAPETPRYLMKTNKRARAVNVMSWIRTGHKRHITSETEVSKAVLEEVDSIANEIQEGAVQGNGTWAEVFEWTSFKRLLIGMWVQLFQQFTGMNIIMYYSTGIFSTIGVSPYLSTALVGIINFLTTFGTLVLVDKVGRKVLLLLGGLGMAISTALGATVITASGGNDNLTTSDGSLVVICVCVFVFSFALTWGPVAWVVTSEIFPLRLRGKLVSITTASNWAGNFAIAFGTPLLLKPSVLDVQGTLFLMSACNVAALVFILLAVPETKGRSLESMDELFEQRSVLDSADYKYYLRCGCCVDCVRHRSRYSTLSGDVDDDDVQAVGGAAASEATFTYNNDG
ncbi:uncharacterized protein LOC135814052 [Sycon ciliatum]|uniref:uncharacterized protein LOC135814052 n=1 Tax=Sycon ciliatum TaxID=27933 RepID=UPI0031F6882B